MSLIISSFDLTNASTVNNTQNINSSYIIGGNFLISTNTSTPPSDYLVPIRSGPRSGDGCFGKFWKHATTIHYAFAAKPCTHIYLSEAHAMCVYIHSHTSFEAPSPWWWWLWCDDDHHQDTCYVVVTIEWSTLSLFMMMVSSRIDSHSMCMCGYQSETLELTGEAGR